MAVSVDFLARNLRMLPVIFIINFIDSRLWKGKCEFRKEMFEFMCYKLLIMIE